MASLLAILTAAVTLLWAFNPTSQWVRAGVIYVSPEGFDGYPGHSPTWAVKTIQRAAELASPGETVIILPGVYAEDIRIRRGGTADRPVVFRARDPGTVTITGVADPQALQKLVWRDEGSGIRSTVAPWPIHRLRWDDATLFHVAWGGLSRLRALTAKPGAWGAFAYDPESKRVFAFLPGDAWRSQPKLLTHRAVPNPREWGNIRSANIWLEADHVVLEGLRFDFGVGAGLLLWNASGLTVRDCLFAGADIGIAAHPRIGGAVQVRVEHSLYHNYPQYHWQRDWLPWREVYASYASSSLVALGGRGVQVVDNLVSNGGDAVQVSPERGDGPWGALVRGNLFFRGTDDAIEAEGEVHGVHILENLVYDHHQNLGLSPVWHGPVLVERNRFLHPHGGLNGSQVKLLNPDPPPGAPPAPPIRNITLRENIFVGRWLAWSNSPVVDVSVTDNAFALQRPQESRWPAGLVEQGNTMSSLPESGYADPGNDPRWWQMANLRMPESLHRPGPRWLDWSESPATRDIVGVLSQAGWRMPPQVAR